MEWERPISVDSCSLEVVLPLLREALLRLEAFLVGEDEVTRNDGGLLLRSQCRCRALNVAWSWLSVLLGGLNFDSFSVRRSVMHHIVERRVFEG
jgi:hypothetical protein